MPAKRTFVGGLVQKPSTIAYPSRLIGRTADFESAYVGSNPAWGAKHIAIVQLERTRPCEGRNREFESH